MSSNKIQSVYPLTPMQEGMLFHFLYDEKDSAYFEQVSYALKGVLNIDIFKKSVAQLVSRHDALRTSIVYEGVSNPMQVVLTEREIQFQYKDLRQKGNDILKSQCIEQYKAEDKEKSFNLTNDILIRIAVLQTHADVFEIIWSYHHIIMDGWCIGILSKEFYTIYHGLNNNISFRLPPVSNNYQSYIEWLKRQDAKISKSFWEGVLDGYETPTGIFGADKKSEQKRGYQNESFELKLGEQLTNDLTKLAISCNVTFNIVIQSIWSILLAKYNNTLDVMFGAVVSGRPSEIPGVEHIVGLFINTIPVRVRFQVNTDFASLAEDIQKRSIESEKYHHYPLAEIQVQWDRKRPLIDHILIFENYPISEQIIANDLIENTFEIFNGQNFEQTSYDLNILILPGSQTIICFKFNENKYTKDRINQIVQDFLSIANEVIKAPYEAVFHSSFDQHKVDEGISEEEKVVTLVEHEPDISKPMDTNQLEIAEKLKIIWKNILDSDRPGLSDNFFELGGHSIKAIRLSSLIYKQFGVRISVRNVFDNPTIKGLSALIAVSENDKYQKIPLVPKSDYYEVSHSQKRLWILNRLEKTTALYNIYFTYKFDNTLNVDAFNKAFEVLVNRHEILRSYFISINDEPKQVVDESYTCQPEIVDFPGAEAEILDDFFSVEINSPFDLEKKGPLLRCKIINNKSNYFLLFVIHHSIADAQSLGVLKTELIILYNAFIKGENNPLKPLRIQYKDFSAWQNNVIKSNGGSEHKKYWIDLFAGELPVLDFPTDKERHPIKTYNGEFLSLDFSEKELLAIKKITITNNSSLFITLLAAVKVLLFRYTGQRDITIGTTVAGREHPELQDQIGFFVNTLVLRSQLEEDITFNGYADILREHVMDGFSHQIYPFDLLVEELNLARDLSRSPLFDILVEFQDMETHTGNPEMDGLSIELVDNKFLTTKYDLSFKFIQEKSLTLYLEFNTDLFDRIRIEKILAHFKELISSLVTNPDQKIRDINLIPNIEIVQAAEFNNTKHDFQDCAVSLTTLLEKQSLDCPDSIATITDDRALTYRELNSLANKLAAYLQQNFKVRKGDVVAILAHRSECLIAAIIAIMKTGAVFLPIDPKNPKERIKYILEDSNAVALLTESEFLFDIDFAINHLFALDVQTYSLPEGDIQYKISTDTSDLLYIIYTSGSTGTPKGVAIENRSFVNYLLWANEYYFGNKCGYHFAFFTSISFDLTLTSIFSTLLRGDKLTIFKDAPIDNLLENVFFGKADVNTVKLTPSSITILSYFAIRPTKIKNVIIGGEELLPSHISTLWNINTEINIYNEYGPTETTVGSSVKKIKNENTNISIGKPIANTKIYLLNSDGVLVPQGVVGYIHIEGAGLAREYINDPKLTTEKFIYRRSITTERLYNTGDLGKWDLNNELQYLGRDDNQIKIRGYRVNLTEIEQVLGADPDVKQVIILNRDAGDPELTAYILSDNSDIEPRLRTLAAKHLPAYMIPDHFIVLNELPVNNNGKADHNQLRSKKPERATKQYNPPSDNTEYKLAEIWGEILLKDILDVEENFFGSGGHSLNAIKLVSRIEKSFNIKLSLMEIFSNPTISALAEIIRTSEKLQVNIINPIQPANVYDLSHGQKGLFFKYMHLREPFVFNMARVFEIQDVDPEKLKSAFNEIIKRHEALRTIFLSLNGEPKLRIIPSEEFKFNIEYHDLRQREDRYGQFKVIRNKLATQKFDFLKGPLFSVNLINIEDDTSFVIFIVDHIICDAWSMTIVEKELAFLYNKNSSTQDVLPPLRIQYKDYAHWQQEQLNQGSFNIYRDFWRNMLGSNLPIIDLPYDYAIPSSISIKIPSYRNHLHKEVEQFFQINPRDVSQLYGVIFSAKPLTGASYKVKIFGKLANDLREIPVKYDLSLFNILLTALNTYLFVLTGQADLVIGTPTSIREDEDVNKIFGWFLDTLILRNHIDENHTFLQNALKISANGAEALDNRFYPFERLLDDLDIPFFKIGKVFLHLMNMEKDHVLNLDPTDVTPMHCNTGTPTFDINFTFIEYANGYELTCDYREELFNAESIAKMIDEYIEILGKIKDYINLPIYQMKNNLNYQGTSQNNTKAI
ncbi:non-ribosomal peptide synthetase [Pedobacter sp. D749]|uniref:non-ribosomal peptide synthetase n=1 Tax=Pedobacter sp. D749 TaxID=2856523 RepID=UPI001C581DBC|nr:non-ribosomal peptide synthetase [Pedobacter sp. D749]QXU43276.1 amino acid adenylation domain-containing protein [Pedobacter sp. D749]